MSSPQVERHGGPGGPDPAPASFWAILRPGRLLFPVALGIGWAAVIGVFASVGVLFPQEGEQGTWGEVAGAVAGNFVVAFVVGLVISVVVRHRRTT